MSRNIETGILPDIAFVLVQGRIIDKILYTKRDLPSTSLNEVAQKRFMNRNLPVQPSFQTAWFW